MKQQQMEKPLEWAMFYLKFRPRSVAEVRRYLRQKQNQRSWSDEEVEEAITRLLELKLLDDGEFAHRFVDSHISAKPRGRRWFVQKLMMAGIAQDIISEALSPFTESEYKRAQKVLEKKYGDYSPQYADPATQSKAQRLLLSRGFSWSDTTSALASWKKKE